MKFVFVPINYRLHWSLACLCNLDAIAVCNVVWRNIPPNWNPLVKREIGGAAGPTRVSRDVYTHAEIDSRKADDGARTLLFSASH